MVDFLPVTLTDIYYSIYTFKKNKYPFPFIYIQLHPIKLLPSSIFTFLPYIFSFPFKVIQRIV